MCVSVSPPAWQHCMFTESQEQMMVEYQLKLRSWIMKRCYLVLWIMKPQHHVWPNAPSLCLMFEPCSLLLDGGSWSGVSLRTVFLLQELIHQTVSCVKRFGVSADVCVKCCGRTQKTSSRFFQVLPGSSRWILWEAPGHRGAWEDLLCADLQVRWTDWAGLNVCLSISLRSTGDLISAADLMVFRSKHFWVKVCWKVFEMSWSVALKGQSDTSSVYPSQWTYSNKCKSLSSQNN